MSGLLPSADWWTTLFDFSDYGELLQLLQNSVYAGILLGIVGGLIGVFVVQRDLAFAVHGVSELSFAGASAGLLLGIGVVPGSLVGSLIAAGLIGVLALNTLFTLTLWNRFDLRPISQMLGAAEQAGRPIAFLGNYEGQFHFEGRLTRPIQELFGNQAVQDRAIEPSAW